MAFLNNNNKRAVESFLVAKGNQSLVNSLTNGGTLPGGGTIPGAGAFDIPLMNSTNAGRVNLADGQLGIFCASGAGNRGLNNALKAADTYANAPAIYIAQGTDTSQTPGNGAYPLINNRPYETSGIIYGHNTVVMTGRIASYDTSSIWSIGRPSSGTVGQINIESLTEYTMGVSFSGYAQDTENPAHARLHTTYNYKSVDYANLSFTDNLDHFIQNFAYEINRNSRLFRHRYSNWGANDPVVAFAIATTGNGGQDIHNAAFDNGGQVNVFTRDGVTQQINLTAEQVASLRVAIPNTHGILNIDLTTAGNAANAVWFNLMALDRELAYDDRVKQVKITLDVGLREGFEETVRQVEEVTPQEGTGKSRWFQLDYENTHGQRKYYQFQRQHWPFIEVESDIVPNTYYSVIILEHLSSAQVGTANVSISPKKTIILLPACESTTRTELLTLLNSWVKSTPSPLLFGETDATGNITIGQPTFCP